MRILQVGFDKTTCSFKNQDIKNDNEFKKYNDPLMKWPLRGAAFTNEVGEALRPVIGNLATISWIPALLYIGADVYDKYKNDKTEFSPDSRRGLQQAVFQGMASIFLPLIAVNFGQKVFSQLGRFDGDGLSYNTKEKISKLAHNFIVNGQLHAYSGRDEECVNEFVNRANIAIDYGKQTETSAKPINKLFNYCEEKILKLLKINPQEKIEQYSMKTIKSLIYGRKKLLNPDSVFLKSDKYQYFIEAKTLGQSENVAVKSTLSHFLNKTTLKGKFVKTIGGFIALGASIKPIDNFVEHTLIDKYLAPRIYNGKE